MHQDDPSLYNAIIVLGNNIRPVDGGYRPSTYENFDQFGMLGGEMTVLASVILHSQHASDTFVFSTGVSEKNVSSFGAKVPAEAVVYRHEFFDGIKRYKLSEPTTILEDRSVNTYTNITECIKIMNDNHWNHVAILTARYHVPRVQALWKLARRQYDVATSVDYLAAEDIVEKNMPGAYDERIKAAYKSPQGQKRLRNEAQGLQDMLDGKYVVSEFQLEK